MYSIDKLGLLLNPQLLTYIPILTKKQVFLKSIFI